VAGWVSTVFYYAHFVVNWKGKTRWCLVCVGCFVEKMGVIGENYFERGPILDGVLE